MINLTKNLLSLIHPVKRQALGSVERFFEQLNSPLLLSALHAPADRYRQSNRALEAVAEALPAVGPLSLAALAGRAIPQQGLSADELGVLRNLAQALDEAAPREPALARHRDRLQRNLALRAPYRTLMIESARAVNRTLSLRQVVNYVLRHFLTNLVDEITPILTGRDFAALERVRRAFSLLVEHKEEYLRDVNDARGQSAQQREELATKLRDLDDQAHLRQVEAAILAGEPVTREALDRAALIWSAQKKAGPAAAAPATPPAAPVRGTVR